MAQVQTITISGVEYTLSNHWKRLGAGLIDILVLTIPGVILGVLAYVAILLVMIPLVLNASTFDETNASASFGPEFFIFIAAVLLISLFVFVINTAIIWAYEAYWPSKHGGQSPGKKTMGIRVIDEEGYVPTLKIMTIRVLVVTGLNTIIGALHYVTIFFTDKRQGLHDMAARTYVVEGGV
ncbi:MAG: RDD family protein [Candidatus Dojkabacteria bacterium]